LSNELEQGLDEYLYSLFLVQTILFFYPQHRMFYKPVNGLYFILLIILNM